MSESSDPFATQLRSLEPTVDMEASRRLFDEGRVPQPSSRRWLLPAAVIALLVAGLVGVWALARDDGGLVPADPIEQPEPTDVDFEVVMVEQTSAPAGSIETATTADELAVALAPIANSPTDLGVNFERSVVAVFNIEGNDCPLELDEFEMSGASDDVWSPRFRAVSQEPCADVGLTWAYVVSFDRGAFGPRVTFLRATGVAEPASVNEPEPGEGFELIKVEQTAVPFGTIRLAQSDDELATWWGDDFPGTQRPDVDFGRSFVAAFTLPDDACPDILVQFRGEVGSDGVIWEPEFEPPPGGCDQPLITRTYVVQIDRPSLAARITFRLPADDVYDYPANEVTIGVAPASATIEFGVEEAEPAAAEVVLRTDLPPAGSAESVMTLLGPIWIVHHDDGSVSALPAVVRVPVDEDIGVTGLGRFVAWDDSTRSFAGRWIHDEYGRAINGPRTDDLVGLEAGVDGEFVEIWRSDRDRVPGAPLDVPLAGDDGLPPLDLGETLDLDVLPTLSFSGPVWRMLDATLVVEQGVGTLCVVDREAPVPDLVSCGGTGVDTAVTSSRPDVTSWFFGPVLAEFDEFGEIITVVTSHGQASRNDGPPADVPLDQIEVVVDDVVSECNPPDPGMVIVTLVPGWDLEVVVDVSVGGDTRGSTTVALRDGVPTEVRVEVTGPLDAAQTVTVRSAVDPTVEYTSLPHVGCA